MSSSQHAGFDPETVAFEAGLKPAMRLALPEPLASRRERELQARGYAVERAARPLSRPGSEPEQVLYVAHDRTDAVALRAAEAPILPGGPPVPPGPLILLAHRTLGRLLGFSPCCVEAFLARLSRDVTRAPDGGRAHEDYVAALDILSRSERLDARLNVLPLDRGAPLLPFYPCRFDCPAAQRWAGACLDAIRARSLHAAETLLRRLGEAVAVERDGRRARPGDAEPDAVRLVFEIL